MDEWKALPEADRKPREMEGMQAWMKWMTDHHDAVVYEGSPLGKTKAVSKAGIMDTRNEMGAFVIVQAASYDEAAKMFEDHPHFMIFPGDRIEVMEMLAMPKVN